MRVFLYCPVYFPLEDSNQQNSWEVFNHEPGTNFYTLYKDRSFLMMDRTHRNCCGYFVIDARILTTTAYSNHPNYFALNDPLNGQFILSHFDKTTNNETPNPFCPTKTAANINTKLKSQTGPA